jgi:hypothetical protein
MVVANKFVRSAFHESRIYRNQASVSNATGMLYTKLIYNTLKLAVA